MQTNQFHILVVDDDEDIKEICSEAFLEEGFKVSSASCGKSALEIFYNENIDVIISDSMMPGITGDQLLSLIKESGSRMPYFYLATGLIDVIEDEYIAKGATGIISKPFDAMAMVDKVKELLTSAA
jgi:CheY-like chemotaxis protein